MSTFPHKISVRDTACNDDLGGLGQRIYTTAGQGYTRQEYIRADIWADLLRENDRLRAEVEALRKLADDLYLIMPGQPGHGDISREQRTKADYIKLRGEEE